MCVLKKNNITVYKPLIFFIILELHHCFNIFQVIDKTFKEGDEVQALYINGGKDKWSEWLDCNIVNVIMSGKYLHKNELQYLFYLPHMHQLVHTWVSEKHHYLHS